MRSTVRLAIRVLAGIAAFAGAVAFIALSLAFLVVVGGFRGNAKLPASCAIVFGAAVEGYDHPGPALLRRITTAVRLYKGGSVKKLIVSGGVGRGAGESLSEGSVMRAQAIAFGVRSFDIVTEELSHSTEENLAYTRPLAQSCESVVGVSDEYHLARIRFLAGRQGWSNLTVMPADVRPGAWSETRSVVREVMALLYYGIGLDRWFGEPSGMPMARHTIREWYGLQIA